MLKENPRHHHHEGGEKIEDFLIVSCVLCVLQLMVAGRWKYICYYGLESDC
jgi:hypothetical protein